MAYQYHGMLCSCLYMFPYVQRNIEKSIEKIVTREKREYWKRRAKKKK